jgi:hypothetical protein
MKYGGYDRDARTNDIEPAELTEAERPPRTFRTLEDVADARRQARVRRRTRREPTRPSIDPRARTR